VLPLFYGVGLQFYEAEAARMNTNGKPGNAFLFALPAYHTYTPDDIIPGITPSLMFLVFKMGQMCCLKFCTSTSSA
jgi:hypothetical protein